jgi:hypothetical protein
VAISPELPDHAAATAEETGVAFEVVSDHRNAVARRFGLVYQFPPELVQPYALALRPILQGKADLVLGSRTLGTREPGSMSAHQVWGNRVVLGLLKLLMGVRVTDLGPFRAIRVEAMAQLDMCHPTYGWPVEMVIKAVRRGLRIAEVPVGTRRRIGRSKVAGTVRGSVLAGYHLIATVLRHGWERSR